MDRGRGGTDSPRVRPLGTQTASPRKSAAAFPLEGRTRGKDTTPKLPLLQVCQSLPLSEAHRILFIFQKVSRYGLGWRIMKALHCRGPFKEHLVPTPSLRARKQGPTLGRTQRGTASWRQNRAGGRAGRKARTPLLLIFSHPPAINGRTGSQCSLEEKKKKKKLIRI